MQIFRKFLCLGVLTLGAVLSAQASDNPDQAAARAALEAKMRELDIQSPAPATVNSQSVVAPVTTKDSQQQAAARAAVQAQMNQLNTQQPELPTRPQSADMSYPGKRLGLSPIVAPALPISLSKQSQLEALLARYKADQITPEEYHKARAEILAAP